MIVGRKREIEELRNLFQSNKAELVAIYGRRRVGKTFLVKEMFHDKMTFYQTVMLIHILIHLFHHHYISLFF